MSLAGLLVAAVDVLFVLAVLWSMNRTTDHDDQMERGKW